MSLSSMLSVSNDMSPPLPQPPLQICLGRTHACLAAQRLLACAQHAQLVPELTNYQGVQQTRTCRAWLQCRSQLTA